MFQALAGSASRVGAVPIWTYARGQSVDKLPAQARNWLTATGGECSAGQVILVPSPEGHLHGVIFGITPDGKATDPFAAGTLAEKLPAGTYAFDVTPENPELTALAFVLGTYNFTRYKQKTTRDVQLIAPDGVDSAEIMRIAQSISLVRDLINTPANDLGPAQLEEATAHMASCFDATFRSVVGDALLEQNFPMIHAVGRASSEAPRLLDFTWGRQDAPKITLVGKGVCYDTGGLDIKPSSGMILMKKDMGGAAMVLGLARMIMDAGLDVRLRVIIPAVENAISGAAFRSSDILQSRKGLTVEIGNTDAEGRLVLADALALADEEAPEILLDFATLTGAARVALGPEIPPFFTDDTAFAAALMHHSKTVHDPLWQLPLWEGYAAMLKTPIADINNTGKGGFAGAITAALFLSRFVEKAKTYVHFDVYGWNTASRPARPEGGEAFAIRAVFSLLNERFGSKD